MFRISNPHQNAREGIPDRQNETVDASKQRKFSILRLGADLETRYQQGGTSILSTMASNDPNGTPSIERLPDTRPKPDKHAFSDSNGAAEYVHLAELPSPLRQVIHKNLVRVDLTSIMNRYKDVLPCISQTMQLISSTALQLSELSICAERDEAPLSPPMLRGEMLNEILKMGNLRVLEINKYHITLDELIELGRKLLSLEHVDIRLFPQCDPMPFENEMLPSVFRDCLGKLQLLRFTVVNVPGSLEFVHDMTRFCVQTLPNLKEIGDPAYFVDLSMVCHLQAQESQLERLMILLSKTQKLTGGCFAMFPNVKSLVLKWDRSGCPPLHDYDFSPLFKFAQLTCIKFVKLNSIATLEIFLRQYGKVLEKLFVIVKRGTRNPIRNVRFASILSYCPQLRMLGMKNVTDPLHDTVWPLSLFMKLETLHLEIQSSNEAVCISDILQAPNLKNVNLFCVQLVPQELKKTDNMIESGKILVKIAKFEMTYYTKNNNLEDDLKNAGENLKNTLNEFRPDAQCKLEMMFMV